MFRFMYNITMQNRVSAFSNLTSKSTRWKTVFLPQNILYLHADSCFLSKWCKLRLDTDECPQSDHRKKNQGDFCRGFRSRAGRHARQVIDSFNWKFHIDFHFVIADFLAHLQLEHQMAVSSAACLEFLGCYVWMNVCLHSPLRCPVLFSFIAFLNMRKLIRSCGSR